MGELTRIYETLKAVNWFSELSGLSKALPDKKFSFVSSLEKITDRDLDAFDFAINAIMDEVISNALKARGLTVRKWNELVEVEKSNLKSELLPLVRSKASEAGVPAMYLGYTEAFLTGYVLEKLGNVSGKYCLFSGAMDVYESGGLVCGWDGDWPDGKYMVLDKKL